MNSETLEDHQTNETKENNVSESVEEPKAEEEKIVEQDATTSEKHDLKEVSENKLKNENAKDEIVEEKKEIVDHNDLKKDEKENGADEKRKAKKLKKELGSEKKSPVTPTSERPYRERKFLVRYREPEISLAKSSSNKDLKFEKGCGTQLKDIPNVAFKLSNSKRDDNLHKLHNILFGKRTKAHHLKRNIGQFSGYLWLENVEKQRKNMKYRLDKCLKEKLLVFCDMLNIRINKSTITKEELTAKLLKFLESPHATTDILLAEKEQKAKKQTRKATPSKSPREASTDTSAKKKKQTPQSGKKRKYSKVEDDKAEISDAKDESQDDEDIAVENNISDDEVPNSKEEDISKTPKSTSKKSITEQEYGSLSKSKEPATKKKKSGKEKSDSKVKSASKTSEASIKDQVKGKSSKKIKVEEPEREDMHAVVVDILKEVDFDTATLSDIIRQLGIHFGIDLMHRKAEVKDIITDIVNNTTDEEDQGEEADNDSDEETVTDGDEEADAGKDSDEDDE